MWVVQKRFGPVDQIAWNFHKGGYFQTVENPQVHDVFKRSIDISEQILKIRKMSFGAVDFIIGKNYKIYFIEINSSPRFTTLSGYIYYNAMTELSILPTNKLKKL